MYLFVSVFVLVCLYLFAFALPIPKFLSDVSFPPPPGPRVKNPLLHIALHVPPPTRRIFARGEQNDKIANLLNFKSAILCLFQLLDDVQWTCALPSNMIS